MSPNYPHAHVCEDCNVVWFHDPLDAAMRDPMVHALAHSCPKCGAEEYFVDAIHTEAMSIQVGRMNR